MSKINRNVVVSVSVVASGLMLCGQTQAQDTFQYDDLGRLIQVDFTDGHSVVYQYDPAGNRTQVVMSRDASSVQDDVTVAEDTALDIDVLSNDTGFIIENMSIANPGSPVNGTAEVINVNGQDWIRYTPNVNFNGVESFDYTVTDGFSTLTGNVTVTVVADNDAPVANNDSISVNEDSTVTKDLRSNDSDPEGSVLIVSSVSGANHGQVIIENSGTRIRYNPNANYYGTDSFSYTVSDGVLTDSATVSVIVAGVNDSPNALNDSSSTNEDTSKVFNPRSNDFDPDGGSITITGKTNGSKGSVAILNSGTQLRYTPGTNKNGSDSFTYTISDGQGGVDTATVSMSIAAVDDVPVARNDSISTNEDTVKTFNPRANDSEYDGQPLSINWKENGSKGSVSIVWNSTHLRYTPHANKFGSDSFRYRITDGTTSRTARVYVTINPVNDKPNAASDSYTIANKNVWTTLYPLTNDTDPEGNSLRITNVFGGAAQYQIINNGAAFRFRNLSSNPPNVVNYSISDGNGGVDGGTIFLTYPPSGGGGGGLPDF